MDRAQSRCEGDRDSGRHNKDRRIRVYGSDDFSIITEKYNNGIVCGFCNEKFDGGNVNIVGITPVANSWFSFQCIRIPNVYAMQCAKWYYDDVKPNNRYSEFTKDGRNDDAMWKKFMIEVHPGEVAHNMICTRNGCKSSGLWRAQHRRYKGPRSANSHWLRG